MDLEWDIPLPPPPHPRESAAEYGARQAYLRAMIAPRGEWKNRRGGEIAFVLEALGVSPDGFEAVLRLAYAVTPLYVPAGVEIGGYRFGVAHPGHPGGEPVGVYLDVMVLAWTITPRR